MDWRCAHARPHVSKVVIARQRWSRSSSWSTAAAAASPRRASAARTASGSRRISWMSSTRDPYGDFGLVAVLFPVTVPGALLPAEDPESAAAIERGARARFQRL